MSNLKKMTGRENIEHVADIMKSEMNKYNLDDIKKITNVKMKFKANEILQILDKKFNLNKDIISESSNKNYVDCINIDEIVSKAIEKDGVDTDDINKAKNLICQNKKITKDNIK